MKNNWLKYIIVFISVFAFRLIPFRAPNIEPVMSTIMPIGKIYGGFFAFIFGFLSIVLFDSITSGIGVWTIITGITYGAIGLYSKYYFKNRSGWKNYAFFAVIGTIIYDVITGLTIGPLLFGMPFYVALIGQIPFTILHLIGNVSFAIVISVAIEKWLMKKEKRIELKESVFVT